MYNAGLANHVLISRYHKVKQSSTDQGCVVAVNYWYGETAETSLKRIPANIHRYDMDFGGPFYSATSFVRSIGLDTQAKKTKS